MSRKLVVRLKGGLGNQLFCYASAKRLAWSNNAELVLDVVTGFKYDHLYRRTFALGDFCISARFATLSEQMEPFGRLRRFVSRKLSEQQPLDKRRYIQQVGINFEPGILDLRLQDGTTYFDPFGQSELYFADIREQIANDLSMVPPTDENNIAMRDQIESAESVALHVRWFDNKNSESSANMTKSYYERALTLLLSRVPNAHFFIFSDRPKEAANLLGSLMSASQFTLVQHNAKSKNVAADFWLMRQCKHFVIGNSTFAWWAAWLGEQHHEGVQILAPKCNVNPERSVTAWGFPGLLPPRWTVL